MPITPEERARIARENGAKSKGPITPEGKAISSRNATKSGEYATIYSPAHVSVLCNESRPAFAALLADRIETYQPCNQLALDLVNKIADAQWHVKRLAHCLAIHWKFAMIDAAAKPVTVIPDLIEEQVMFRASASLFAGDALALRISRQIDALERRIAQCERRLKFVQANYSHAAANRTQPVEEQPAENTDLTPDTPENCEEIEPAIFVTENNPKVLEAYRLQYPGRKIVILPPDDVAKGIDEVDNLPPVPRIAA